MKRPRIGLLLVKTGGKWIFRVDVGAFYKMYEVNGTLEDKLPSILQEAEIWMADELEKINPQ